MDPYGKACLDYLKGNKNAEIDIYGEDAEMDPLPVEYLFRKFQLMPKIEQKALELSEGKILDVGAGAGSHSLELQKLNKNVTALEISPLLCQVMKERGVKHIIQSDIYDYQASTFDTILFLMNGIGMCRDFNGLKKLLTHLKPLLNPKGQILLDSSDLIFMFMDDEGVIDLPLLDKYYGEFPFTMTYQSEQIKDQWLYIDFDNLSDIATSCGYTCELILTGEHYDYLARLRRM